MFTELLEVTMTRDFISVIIMLKDLISILYTQTCDNDYAAGQQAI